MRRQVYSDHLEPYGCTGARQRSLGTTGHFAPVRVNDTLTLDLNDTTHFDVHYYAFHVSDEEFDAILRRVQEAEIAFGSDPWSREG